MRGIQYFIYTYQDFSMYLYAALGIRSIHKTCYLERSFFLVEPSGVEPEVQGDVLLSQAVHVVEPASLLALLKA